MAEGLSLRAYQDGGGVWTIGFGHTRGVKPGDVCSLAQAEGWLDDDIQVALGDLDKHLSWWKVAPDPVRRGLLNMCFNLGYPRLSGFCEMLAAGERGDWDLMAVEALDSKWSEQVGDRSEFIAELFRSAGKANGTGTATA